MSDQKFDPVKEFVTLRDNISKTVGEGLRSVTGRLSDFPLVDIYETEESVMVYTEPLLGADPSSIEVSVENDILFIKGKTKPPFDISELAYIQRELRFGQFSRELRIPRHVKADEANATFKNGSLVITLPKQEQRGNQIIGVTAAE